MARELIREYADGLGFSLDFQDLETEIRELPGPYGPPVGELLLASVGAHEAGCVALRRFGEQDCEMKRLYVQPAHRGTGVGRALAEGIIEVAGRLGYRAMLLDTVPSMTRAIELYRSLGFVEIAPYRYNPVSGAVYLRRKLP